MHIFPFASYKCYITYKQQCQGFQSSSSRTPWGWVPPKPGKCLPSSPPKTKALPQIFKNIFKKRAFPASCEFWLIQGREGQKDKKEALVLAGEAADHSPPVLPPRLLFPERTWPLIQMISINERAIRDRSCEESYFSSIFYTRTVEKV